MPVYVFADSVAGSARLNVIAVVTVLLKLFVSRFPVPVVPQAPPAPIGVAAVSVALHGFAAPPLKLADRLELGIKFVPSVKAEVAVATPANRVNEVRVECRFQVVTQEIGTLPGTVVPAAAANVTPAVGVHATVRVSVPTNDNGIGVLDAIRGA